MPEQPNILLILTDQHRLSAVGAYGPTPCRTPHLDRLAAQGARFETAYTSCPVCTPARASVITGLYPHAHRMNANSGDLGCGLQNLQDGPDLLSRRLQAAGYLCGYSGKWHLCPGWRFPEMAALTVPSSVGFVGQDFPGHGGGGFNYPEYQDYLRRHGWRHEVETPRREPSLAMPYGILRGGPAASTEAHFLADNTIALIDQARKAHRPFFIWHNFWGPHAPYYVPPEYYEMYRDVEIPEWPNYRWDGAGAAGFHRVKRHPHQDRFTWEDWAEAIRHYYAFTTLIDDQIGRMLAHLEATGLADDTLVVFCADHGETLGSHGGLTDKGWHHFEEIQRIPLIVRPPRHRGSWLAPGAVLPQWASILDLYPTFLETAGCDLPETVHGRSLLPLLRGEEPPWRDAAFVEFFGVNSLSATMASCRHGDLKYGWNNGGDDELYDLAADPHETRNLAAEPDWQAEVGEMRERLDRFFAATRAPFRLMYRQSRLAEYRTT